MITLATAIAPVAVLSPSATPVHHRFGGEVAAGCWAGWWSMFWIALGSPPKWRPRYGLRRLRGIGQPAWFSPELEERRKP